MSGQDSRAGSGQNSQNSGAGSGQSSQNSRAGSGQNSQNSSAGSGQNSGVGNSQSSSTGKSQDSVAGKGQDSSAGKSQDSVARSGQSNSAGKQAGGSGNSKQVYLKVAQITEVQSQDVFLKDIAKVTCKDQVLLNKCNSLKVKKIREKKEKKYVEDVLDIIDKISQLDPDAQVDNVGEIDYIIDYRPPKPSKVLWQWCKTVFVCIACFCGAAFAIMTFNNDADVPKLFAELHRLVLGQESDGFTVLEASYSVGLAAGILLFFNHFAKWKLTTDPTPLEVEMRTYEDDICKTLIQDAGRKETEVDIR